MDVGGELDLRIDPKLATQVFVSSSSNPKDLVWGIRCSIKETNFGEEGNAQRFVRIGTRPDIQPPFMATIEEP